RWRLSLLMFLYYAIQGAFVPLFSLRLQELGLTPLEMGWACATQALAALVAPLAAGQIADRWLPAERCLAVCALVSGTLLWVLACGSARALPPLPPGSSSFCLRSAASWCISVVASSLVGFYRVGRVVFGSARGPGLPGCLRVRGPGTCPPHPRRSKRSNASHFI